MESNFKKNNPAVPDFKKLKSVQELCLIEQPYLKDNDDALFMMAIRESMEWHRTNCQFFEKLLNFQKIEIANFKEIKDLEKVPYIMANYFKQKEVLSIPKEEVYLHLTSSGTTGQKSQIFFDKWTIESAQKMVTSIFQFYGWITPAQKTNYVLYTYEPEEGSKLGTAYTDHFLCQYAPVQDVTYALRYAGPNDGHKFDVFGVIEAFKKYEESGLPVRIFGFPAFFYFTLKKMKELGIRPLKLNPESLVFLGGGWKGHQGEAISKNDLYDLAENVLGLKNKRLRDGFGSVEHCIPYVECSNHEFHIPTWSRVIIRDVQTLKPKLSGEAGYLNFISPYITSTPAISVLMGDLATRHEAHECDCGLMTPFFRIIGRAGVSSNKSCAIAASEILSKW